MATDLEESARRAGHHQWAESRLFEVVGGWVPSVPELEAKLLFDRHSAHHAWRAGEWRDRLPVLADVDREQLCAPPAGWAGVAVERLAALEGTVARLAGLYRFALPRLWVAYRDHRRVAGEVADGSTLRTLEIVSADLAADWHEGEALLQSLITDRRLVVGAAGAVARLEEALVPESEAVVGTA